jgi:hypothetical protein
MIATGSGVAQALSHCFRGSFIGVLKHLGQHRQ